VAGAIFHVGASAMCPHGGQVTTAPGAARVLVGGQPAATMSDTFTIAGCSFTVPGPKPQPCVKVQWLAAATRVLIGGQPAILRTSSALCQSAEQIPGGPPSIATTQMRVTGT
jgi:uncharacterized Zn-binding protein involved in type VI secretion